MTYAAAILATHPWPGDIERDGLAACIEACRECSQSCTACADVCLAEQGISNLRKCIRLNLDCADICDATGRVLSRQTEFDPPLSQAQLDACREACRTCADECGRHSEMHKHCQICARACQRCEKACGYLLESLR